MKNRIIFIDISKGILILCVVIGHVINFNNLGTAFLKTVIYTFHMPAFFVVSGMLIKKEKIRKLPLKEFIIIKGKKLIIPYIIFELIAGILHIFLFETEIVNLMIIIKNMLTLHCNLGANWFLPTLFFAEILLFLFVKSGDYKLKYIIPFLGFVCAFIFANKTIYFVDVICRIFVAFSFLVFGYLFKDFLSKKNLFIFCIATIGLIMISYLNGVVDLSLRQFNNPLLYVIGGLLGTISILNLSHFIRENRLLQYLGLNSLIIMGIHQDIYEVISFLLIDLIDGSYSIINQVFIFFLVLSCNVAIILFYKKIIFYIKKLWFQINKTKY